MNIEFRPLFTVQVTHPFYAERCRDFRFVLPADSARALGGARAVAKELDGRLHVLYEAGPAGAPIVDLAGTALRVGLVLVNPYFGNVTDLAALAPEFPRRRLRYTNAAPPATALAAAPSVALVGPLFAHALTGPARPATLTLRDASGAVVREEALPLGDGRASVAFDLRGRAGGLYNLTQRLPAQTTVTPYYVDAELHALDAAAVLDVTVGAGFAAAPPAFDVAFAARADVLRYYVVARNYSAAELAQLAVSDVGFTDDARAEVEFERVAAADFGAAELSPALISRAGERVVLFRSEGALPRRERGRRRIQLSKNGDVLIANLPQPGADRAAADLIVHVAKP